MERWQRLPEGGGDFLALYCPGPRPAVLCVVGDHFAFTEDRRELPNFEGATTGGCASLADWAWTKGDRKSLEALLSLEGSYGRVSTGWKISHSTLPWREGSVLLQPGQVKLAKVNSDGSVGSVLWSSQEWIVFENSFTLDKLSHLLGVSLSSRL